jgi:hypothetical protein
MDHGSFDRIARLLGAAGSRRAALGTLFGTGLTGTLGAAAAAKKHRKKGKSQVSAQALPDCLNPGVGSNISGCNYQNEDFSGDNISSSRMVATNFRNAELVETNLSSSNAKDAIFRDANLCGANLRSSTLRGANFQGANLAFANLSSSACAGATFTASTFWCGTRDCNGNLRNDDCPGGDTGGVCCSDAECPTNQTCSGGRCVPLGQLFHCVCINGPGGDVCKPLDCVAINLHDVCEEFCSGAGGSGAGTGCVGERTCVL